MITQKFITVESKNKNFSILLHLIYECITDKGVDNDKMK